MTENDDLEERAAIIADGCRVPQAQALEMAQQQQQDEEKRLKGNRAWKQGELLR